jgi:SAM-dependent methyltransferase
MNSIPETEGRNAFGANVDGYDMSRPEYPAWIFDVLISENILYRDAATLEIGPGNGLATRKLVETGVSPLILVEPDKRFAPFLDALSIEAGDHSQVIYTALEDVELPRASFNLVVIATAFHWLSPKTRVKTLANLTAPGGFVVLMWNVFQDLNLPDAFHEATKDMLADLSNSPSGNPDSLPFALDRNAREKEFLSTKYFELSMYAESHWTLSLDPIGVRSLYEGFSNISQLPDKERTALLDQIELVAKSEFGGIVERNITSPLYVFRRV